MGPAFEVQGQGPTVVFVHNAGTDCGLWAPVVERLVGRFTCVALDLPGFGESPAPQDPCLGAYVDAVGQVVDEVGPVAGLVGHCVGGAACWELVRRRPEVTRRLVLSAPATLATMQAGPYGVLQRHLPGHPRRDRVALWLARAGLGFGPTRRLVVRSQTRHVTEHLDACHGRADHLESLHGLLHRFDSFGVLDEADARPAVPTMLLWGRWNRVLPVARMEPVAEVVQPVEEHVLEAGHLAMVDEPGRFADLVARFVGG